MTAAAPPGSAPPAAPPGSAPPRSARRTALPYVLLGAGVLLLTVLALRPQDTGLPLDPTSPGPLGTKGLVDVLAELGADVDVLDRAPGPDHDAALLLEDAYDEAQRDELRAWVADGGVLVVADPFSPLTPDPVNATDLLFTNPSIARDCDLRALALVGRVTVPGGAVYPEPARGVGCFPRNDAFWLVTIPEGAGTIVALGGAETFTNLELGDADNMLLAASLLAPEPDEDTVAVLQPPPPGSGRETLVDLVPDAARWAFVQLLVAFAVVVAWQARRFGRPVLEPAAVEVPGSELVVARGNLLQTAGAAPHAADLMRADARRWLAERLGLAARADAEQVADAAAARTGATREEVLALLQGGGAGDQTGRARIDEDGLVALAQRLEHARHRTLASPPPAGGRRP